MARMLGVSESFMPEAQVMGCVFIRTWDFMILFSIVLYRFTFATIQVCKVFHGSANSVPGTARCM